MIGWAIIAAVAAYGMVNIYNSEKHTNHNNIYITTADYNDLRLLFL